MLVFFAVKGVGTPVWFLPWMLALAFVEIRTLESKVKRLESRSETTAATAPSGYRPTATGFWSRG